MWGFGWNQRKRFMPQAVKPAAKRAKTLAGKVTRLQRQVALLKPEVKVLYTPISQSNITQAAGFIAYVSDVLQGTGEGGRVGDNVRGVSIRLRGTMEPTGSTSFRVCIIKDLDSNGVIPVIGSSANAVFENFIARTTFQNTATMKRFRVLWEQYFSAATITQGALNAGYFDSGVIKLNTVSTYVAAGGTVADAGKNQYYIIILVDDADTADVNARVQFKYTDV